MTVGLLSMLVIMQTLSVFETQKRSTTAGSDAQANGMMAMVNIEQSIRSAGAGFAGSSAFVCTTIYAWNATAGALTIPSFSPISIVDGGATGSDTIAIQTSTNFLGNIPTTITSTMPSSSSELNVSRTTGFTDGDLILVANLATGNCTLMQITAVQPGPKKLQHNPGGSGTFNPTVSYQNTNTWPSLMVVLVVLVRLDISERITLNSTSANHSRPQRFGANTTTPVEFRRRCGSCARHGGRSRRPATPQRPQRS